MDFSISFDSTSSKLTKLLNALKIIIALRDEPQKICSQIQYYKQCQDQDIKSQFKRKIYQICKILCEQVHYIKLLKTLYRTESLSSKKQQNIFNEGRMIQSRLNQIANLIFNLGRKKAYQKQIFKNFNFNDGINKNQKQILDDMVKKLKNLSRKSYKYELVMSGIKNFNRKSDKNFVQAMGKQAEQQFAQQQLQDFLIFSQRMKKKKGFFQVTSAPQPEQINKQLKLMYQSLKQMQTKTKYEQIYQKQKQILKQLNNRSHQKLFYQFSGYIKQNFAIKEILSQFTKYLTQDHYNIANLLSIIDSNTILNPNIKYNFLRIAQKFQDIEKCKNIFAFYQFQMNQKQIREFFQYVYRLYQVGRRILYDIGKRYKENRDCRKIQVLYIPQQDKSKRIQIFSFLKHIYKLVQFYMPNQTKIQKNSPNNAQNNYPAYKNMPINIKQQHSTKTNQKIFNLDTHHIGQQIPQSVKLVIQAKNSVIGKLMSQIQNKNTTIQMLNSNCLRQIQNNKKNKQEIVGRLKEKCLQLQKQLDKARRQNYILIQKQKQKQKAKMNDDRNKNLYQLPPHTQPQSFSSPSKNQHISQQQIPNLTQFYTNQFKLQQQRLKKQHTKQILKKNTQIQQIKIFNKELQDKLSLKSKDCQQLKKQLSELTRQKIRLQGIKSNLQNQILHYKQLEGVKYKLESQVEKYKQISVQISKKQEEFKQSDNIIKKYEEKLEMYKYISYFSGNILNPLEQQPPNFNKTTTQIKRLLQEIQKKTLKKIQKTELIYKMDKKNPVSVHKYIDGVQNWVLLFKLQNGYIIGGFCQDPITNVQKQQYSKNAIIFNLQTDKFYHMLEKNNSKTGGFQYNQFYLILGNSQIRFNLQSYMVENDFGSNYKYFNTKTDRAEGFFGTKEKIGIFGYQFYRVLFE